jgi:hypothetical protein
VEAGTLTAEVSRRLGHASPAFIDAVYVHPTRTTQKAAALAYEQRLGKTTRRPTATKSTTTPLAPAKTLAALQGL